MFELVSSERFAWMLTNWENSNSKTRKTELLHLIKTPGSKMNLVQQNFSPRICEISWKEQNNQVSS